MFPLRIAPTSLITFCSQLLFRIQGSCNLKRFWKHRPGVNFSPEDGKQWLLVSQRCGSCGIHITISVSSDVFHFAEHKRYLHDVVHSILFSDILKKILIWKILRKWRNLRGPWESCPALTITTQFLLFRYPPPQYPIISNLIHSSFRHLVYISNHWEFVHLTAYILLLERVNILCILYSSAFKRNLQKISFKVISLSTLWEKFFSMILVCFVG